MNVLIIGNTSVIGLRIYEKLSKKHTVFTAGRNGNPDLYLDLKSFNTFSGTFSEVDVIIHCAASFGNNTLNEMINNEVVNSVGSFIIADLAKKLKCKHLIYLSSISAYNEKSNEYFGSYGLSKKHGQENLEFLCKLFNIQFTSLLFSQIYDEYGKLRKHQPLFYKIIDCAKNNKDITIFGKKDPKRNFMFIEDLVDIIDLIIENNVSGIYPCIHPSTYTITEVAGKAIEVFRSKSRIVFNEELDDIDNIYIPQNFELYKLINFIPKTSLIDGIKMVSEYLYE